MLTAIFLTAVITLFYATSVLMLLYKYRSDGKKQLAILIEWFFIQIATTVIIFCMCGIYYGPTEFLKQPIPFFNNN